MRSLSRLMVSFRDCLPQGFRVLEIHSRKSQGHRNKVSEQFRNGRGLIMFTSDVSARGMDYPDVSTVIQVSLFNFINSDQISPRLLLRSGQFSIIRTIIIIIIILEL